MFPGLIHRVSLQKPHRCQNSIHAMAKMVLSLTPDRKNIWIIVLSVILSSSMVKSKYLAEPDVLWSYQLPGSGSLAGPGLRKGNAIVAMEKYLFATTDEGSLHIISLFDNEKIHIKGPVLQGTFAECHSGVSISKDNNGDMNYLVYAVQFTPNLSGKDNTFYFIERMSRVIAVHIDGTIRWTKDLVGKISGTPVISENFIYISISNKHDGGQIVILRDEGRDEWPTVAAKISSGDKSNKKTFGPLTLQTSLDGHDFIFWGESDYETSLNGDFFAYALYRSEKFASNQGIGPDSYTMKTITKWDRSLITQPLIARDLSLVFMGGSGSSVSGWVNGLNTSSDSMGIAEFDWLNVMQKPEVNPSRPMISDMTLSRDNKFLFLTDNSFYMYCLETMTGKIVWSSDGNRESGYVVQPKLSEIPEESPMVYTIETLRGNVRQHNANNGYINWEFNCYNLSREKLCGHSVEGEFSLSPDGNILYYGDIFGKITALQVATFMTNALSTSSTTGPSTNPTTIPSSNPTNLAPTDPYVIPNTIPSIAPITLVPSISSPIISTPIMGSIITNVPTTPPPSSQHSGTVSPTDSISILNDGTPNLIPSTVPISGTLPPISGIDNWNVPVSVESDKNSMLLIALIAVFVGCALVAITFFLLIVKKRRQERKQDSAKLFRASNIEKSNHNIMAEEEVEEEFEEEHQTNKIAKLVIVNRGLSAPITPRKRKQNKVVKTPTTLESIEETPEDVSVVSSVDGNNEKANGYNMVPSFTNLTWSDKPAKKSVTKIPDLRGNDGEEGSASYLPKSLSATFDQVIQNVIDVGITNNIETEADARKANGRERKKPDECNLLVLNKENVKEDDQSIHVSDSENTNIILPNLMSVPSSPPPPPHLHIQHLQRYHPTLMIQTQSVQNRFLLKRMKLLPTNCHQHQL